jgi:signal transduction histidine kinase
MRATVPGLRAGIGCGGRTPLAECSPRHSPSWSSAAIAHGDGLLHDARNLMGALGLYCDLLSMPGVLKPEHRHYAAEVRLLGTRSAAMIQQLMERRFQEATAASDCSCLSAVSQAAGACLQRDAGGQSGGRSGQAGAKVQPGNLRMIVERCSGLLQQVACGRSIEFHYGAAASVPVRVAEEAVERILVNLVRNAAAALDRLDPAGRIGEGHVVTVGEGNGSSAVARGVIRISVGMLVDRAGDAKPWPFRRVRLAIEDTGCGLTPDRLEWLVSTQRAAARGCHGIGFHVVQNLVAASDGELTVMSSPGAGTRVQIEWPIAGASLPETAERDGGASGRAERRQSC